ncbi:copper resistance protein CopD [Campylobacter canadensis]|uniref:copper resistance protein CopD n=1 Tax=Campylobacter canadensis TaxID=449520 RepID=UPI0015549184|nr:copper resistance protein CopD [Campylobacter canadensis]MBZ7994506.1 copper resistance protein CopD [Campylobacter canadensis]MBZ7997193.1 copper resistance protein CopD [Campylobacter canadensis]MBZ7999779.1 copper resistance protein CopD [Campylobacter canadensis]MBZ8002541.1 copper resistance protein CopD [Campylobacter canadensis]MBZ8002913.1 copper resistance protein CopD [Campylobacter canadensis]
MENIYPYALLVHIFCAIIFIGYLFFDVVIFSRAKKSLDEKTANLMEKAISSKAIKIMPICVLLLLLTGGMMMSKWVNKELGYFDSSLQVLFMIKVSLACIIFLAVIFSLSCKFIFKIPNPLAKIIHPLALTLAICIVFLAKFMFYL